MREHTKNDPWEGKNLGLAHDCFKWYKSAHIFFYRVTIKSYVRDDHSDKSIVCYFSEGTTECHQSPLEKVAHD